ncbi:MAG: hypothetical protein ACHBN1_11840 [Heteroscytonema crispum UTEX LB 1556]
MLPTNQPVNLPDMDRLIVRPLTVAPDTPVIDAIAFMKQTRGSRCKLPDHGALPDFSLLNQESTSCALVVEDVQLVKIFTVFNVRILTLNTV